MGDFQYLNFPAGEPLPKFDSEGRVTLKTKPKTDVWRPPTRDDFNAPFMYKSLPVSKFESVRVSAEGKWKYLYDQAGLMIVLPARKSNPDGPRRWIKTGIEYYQERPQASVVVADPWSDWSLLPLPESLEKQGRINLVVEREQKDGEFSSVLRVILVDGDNKGLPIREVTAAFHDVDEEQDILVGITVAKPQGEDELSATFDGFKIETR